MCGCWKDTAERLYKPQDSKSRTMTAIWARFAASATRVKSLRKASADEVTGAGPRAIGADIGGLMGEVCEVEEAEDLEGEEMGASMLKVEGLL
jgi:hypothetical protein